MLVVYILRSARMAATTSALPSGNDQSFRPSRYHSCNRVAFLITSQRSPRRKRMIVRTGHPEGDTPYPVSLCVLITVLSYVRRRWYPGEADQAPLSRPSVRHLTQEGDNATDVVSGMRRPCREWSRVLLIVRARPPQSSGIRSREALSPDEFRLCDLAIGRLP